MLKHLSRLVILLCSGLAYGQLVPCTNTPPTTTPNLGFQLPVTNACNWGPPWITDVTMLDLLLSGHANLTALSFASGTITGPFTVQTKNQGTNLTLHSTALAINCSTNMTCADDGTTLTLTSTGGGGSTPTGTGFVHITSSVQDGAARAVDVSSADITGNMGVSHLNSGTSASSTTFWRGDATWATPAGAGTVTSFSAGTLSPLFTTSVATATSTPALTFAQVSQAQNLFFASPNGSSGNPAFRAVVAADVPTLNQNTTGTASALTSTPTNCGAGIAAIGILANGNATGCFTPPAGTVTSVATTSPITGGPFSTTGTIACATCVTSTSPGLGLAHFPGSSQNVTSSLAVQADVTNGYVDLSSNQASIAGNKTFTGNHTLTGATTTSSLNAILTLDGTTYTTLQALLTASLSICTGSVSCILDARNPSFGTQTLTNTTFPTVPTTLLTGPYIIQFDTTTLQGLQIASNFRWVSDNTTLRPSASDVPQIACSAPISSVGGLISPIVVTTTGSITSASATLTVASANYLQIGSMVAIGPMVPMNGSNGEGTQSTTINQVGGIAAGDASFVATSTSHFGTAGGTVKDNFILIDSEIMSYGTSDATHFSTLSRGLYGTTAASHINGSTIYQLGWFSSEVIGISGTTITLAEPAPATVTTATVAIGTSNISLEGLLYLDGRQVTHSAPVSGCSNLTAFAGFLVSDLSVMSSVEFQNLNLYGMFITMGRRNIIEGHFANIGLGSPYTAGADIALFGQAKDNAIRTASHSGGFYQILIDDRSVTTQAIDGASNFNDVMLASDDGIKYRFGAVDVEGTSSYNNVRVAYINAQVAGVWLTTSGQWTTDANMNGNRVDVGAIDSSSGAVNLTSVNGGSVVGAFVTVGKINSGTVSTSAVTSTVLVGQGSPNLFASASAFGALSAPLGQVHAQFNASSGIMPTISPAGAASLIGDTNATMGTGTSKGYGVIGVCRGSSDASGDRCYGGYFKSTAGVNISTEVGIHAESADATGTAAEFGNGGLVKASVAGSGAISGLSVSTGTTPPACTAGTAGFTCNGEGTAPTNVASTATIYPSSTTHEYMAVTNGASTATPGMMVRVQPSPINNTAKTAAVTTATLCASAAGACNTAGQYRLTYNVWGSGTACATVTAGSLVLNFTWTDENAVTHTTINAPMWDQKTAAITSGQVNFNTALGTEGGSGSFIISTNGTIIQYATTYTACTSGTGTYNLRIAAERLQ